MDTSNAHSAVSYYYLSPTAVTSIPLFTYDGADHSLLYKYILSPLASFLVRCTPNTVAPNTITLIGLLIMFSSYGLFWYQCPTIEECVYKSQEDYFPNWIFLFNTISMLLYQTLDNMDGKHARKTNSSSPLGLLFDHGCDAINSLFGSVNWIIAMGLSLDQHSWECWVVILMPMIAFYIATWEEYYTGKLRLPVFNGPSEGLFMGASLSLVSFWYGRGYWHNTQWFDTIFVSWLPTTIHQYIVPAGNGVTNYKMVVWCAVISGIREICERIFIVTKSHGPWAITNLFPIISLSGLTFGIPYIDLSVLVRNPRICLHLCSCLFVEMTTALMLDHIGQTKYQPRRAALIPSFVIILALNGGKDNGLLSDEDLDRYLLIYTVTVIVSTSLKCMILINEICCVLGVYCFDIISPHPLANSSKKNE